MANIHAGKRAADGNSDKETEHDALWGMGGKQKNTFRRVSGTIGP